jgi:hypothetical protein
LKDAEECAVSTKRKIPAWVHRAKEGALSLGFAANDTHRDRLISVINDLANSADLAGAWVALEKKFEASEVIRAEYGKKHFPFIWEFPEHEPPKLAPEQHMLALADACLIALEGFTAYEQMPSAQREEKAKDLINLARGLAQKLRQLEHPIFGLPEEFDLTEVGYEIGVETYARLHNAYDRGEEWHKGYLAGAFDFPPAIANHLPRVLDALASRVSVWSKSPAIVSKPSLVTAKREYFIKSLLIYFNNTYGDAMPGAVLAFTCIFFSDAKSLKISSITAMWNTVRATRE